MAQRNLDRLWDPTTLSRIGGGVQGGSTKTPREQEAMDRKHVGRDDPDHPEGGLPPQKPAPEQQHPPQVHPPQVHPAQEHPAQVHPQQERAGGSDPKR